MTSYLDHKMIFVRQTFPNVLMKIEHDDVTWRHVTYFDPKVVKSVKKSADISKKWRKMGWPNIIFSKGLYYTFKMRGQPLLYDNWFKSYGSWSMTHIFSWKFWKSLQKMLTSAKILTSDWNFLLETNVLMFLHNHAAPHLHCACFTDFNQGVIYPRPRVK